MGEIIHGKASSYTNHGCKCAACKKAWAELIAQSKARRATRPVPEHLHGTQNAYGNYGCRCRPCTDAWSASTVDRNRRRRELGPQTANIGQANKGKGKLSQQDADDIRSRLAAGERVAHLAVEYGVTPNAIYLVRDNRILATLTG